MKKETKKKDVVSAVYFVEMRKNEPPEKQHSMIRFIVKLNACKEIATYDAKMKKDVSAWWTKKMGSRRVPKYLISFSREDVRWSSIDKYFLPIRFSNKIDGDVAVKELLASHTFADVVKEIPEHLVETEVEKWKMLTEL